MSSSTTTVASTIDLENRIVAHYSLVLIIVGTLFNAITFLVLCRPLFRGTKTRPTLHYMRTIAIFDILMLYGWNFDHYVYPIYGFYLSRASIGACKFLSFLNYFAAQSSAWLRVFVSFDRYLSLTRLHRTWFNNSKHVIIIISCILIVFFLLNLQFFPLACYYTAAGKISAYSKYFKLYPMWDYINLTFYNCLPFIFMCVFNGGAIYSLVRHRQTTMIQNSQIQHRSVSITLITTTFLFLIMTVPATVAFAFFTNANATLLRALDCMLYTYHVLSFPLYMITFTEFREEFVSIITCRARGQRIRPVVNAVRLTNESAKRIVE